jgi:hypothetical protein
MDPLARRRNASRDPESGRAPQQRDAAENVHQQLLEVSRLLAELQRRTAALAKNEDLRAVLRRPFARSWRSTASQYSRGSSSAHELTEAKWRGQFVERRLEGLYDEPRVGAPRTISDMQVEAIIVKDARNDAGPARRTGVPDPWRKLRG